MDRPSSSPNHDSSSPNGGGPADGTGREALVRGVLASIHDPETGRNLVAAGQVRAVDVTGERVAVTVGLTSFAAPLRPEIEQTIRERLATALPDGTPVDLTITDHKRIATPVGQVRIPAKAIVAVGSGKGGVGKSTVAASIAFGLARAGCKVGLIDADIYGPSVPHLLGVTGLTEPTNNRFTPVDVDGVKVISMGLIIPKEQAVIWRGPMVHKAITQFLGQTEWGELDYCILDLPPGTGDIPLTLNQIVELTGAVVVCTPQDVALLDAIKALMMFQRLGTPILGMVENMSGFVCPTCHTRHDIFGHGGARSEAETAQVPFLGEIPLNLGIRIKGDAGAIKTIFDDPAVAPSIERIVLSLAREIARIRAAKPVEMTLPVL